MPIYERISKNYEYSIDDISMESMIAIAQYQIDSSSIIQETGVLLLNKAISDENILIEGTNLNIFFIKIKNAIQKFFEKIVNIFKKFIQYFVVLYNKFFNMYTKNKDKIKKGYEILKDTDKSPGYYSRLPKDEIYTSLSDEASKIYESIFKISKINKLEELDSIVASENDYKDAFIKVLENDYSCKNLTIEGLTEELKEVLLGKYVHRWMNPNSIQYYIKSYKRHEYNIKNNKNSFERTIKDIFNNIDILQRKANKLDDENQRAKYLRACSIVFNNASLALSATQKEVSAHLQAEKILFDQAVKFANMYINAVDGSKNDSSSNNIGEAFKKEVDNKNMLGVHIMLCDAMLSDLTQEMFKDMCKYAEKRLPNLYDDHDGEEFNTDKSSWNEDMLNRQFVRAKGYNFSKERLKFIDELIQYIYADRIEEDKSKKVKSESVSFFDLYN